MASSSSHKIWNYHVFLSFHGSDTRQTFVSHLYKALSNKGILTFKDDIELKKGDSITNEIIRAIRSSRFAIVVVSENYASSRWCLDELQVIMELQLRGELVVFPIFYGVEPSDVRYQKGSFAKSFQKHKTRENAANVSSWRKALSRLFGKHETPEQPRKVSEWRKACTRFAELAGVESTKCADEATMIDNLIEDISRQLPSMQPLDFSNIVGMTNQMARISPLLEIDSVDVRMIGIWGMGGIGKTTLAYYLYEEHKRKFAPHHCFIKLTGEYSLLYLQEQLLSNIFYQKNMKLESVEQGRQQLELRLKHRKVFLVLDDVEHVSQVDALAKSTTWFGPGSRIIITTRDRGLLKACRVDNVHEVKCLNDVDSLQMFKQIAFEGGIPPSDGHNQLSIRASQLVQGLPSAIEAFGTYLRGKTSIEEWVSSLSRLEKNPPTNIMTVLKLSYNGLEKQDKNIFLHIVFLFNGSTVWRVITLLDDDELETKMGLTNLVNKSLINVSSDGCICMHVLVEQMGREVVHLSEREPHRRRFLMNTEDIYNVLSRDMGQGTEQIQCMTLHTCGMPMTIRMDLLGLMHNLKFLKFYKHLDGFNSQPRESLGFIHLPGELRLLHWDACPLSDLDFIRAYTIHDSHLQSLTCLVEVNLRYNNLKNLKLHDFQKLKRLDLTGSWRMGDIPGLSSATKLEELILNEFPGIENIKNSISCLPSLRKLNVGYLDGITKITGIQYDAINRCRQIELTLPKEKSMNYLTDLSIDQGLIQINLLGIKGNAKVFSISSNPQIHDQMMITGQKQATPQVISEVQDFKSLNIKHWVNGVPFECSSFSNFICLIELSLVNLRITKIPDDIGELQSLEKLDLSGNYFVSLPTTMGRQAKLKYLRLGNCRQLKSLPQLPQVERLTLLGCINLHSLLEDVPGVKKDAISYNLLELYLVNCKNIDSLSYELGCFTNLTYVDLSTQDIETLPSSIKDLSSLVTLLLTNCKKLTSIEELPLSLKYLSAHGARLLENVSFSLNHSINHLDFSHCFGLSQYEEVITQFLNHQHSEVVTTRFACLPATKVPSFCFDRSSGTSLPFFVLSSRFMGIDVCIMIASYIHLQFPTLSYTWNWETNGKLALTIRPDIYHPPQEYEFPTHQLVIIHFPSTVISEVVHGLQFEAKLEFSEKPDPKVDITSCGIRVIYKDT